MQRTAIEKTNADLIKFLADPASYRGRPSVEQMETHISLVFIAGDDVYKLKKAVKYDFVDFSTVALRKKACEAEVQLNRRMAPSVYLGVESIRRTAGGKLIWHGSESDEIVDWVVHMRRLDASRTLANRLQSSNAKQKVEDIRNVSRFLATYYSAQAPMTVRTKAFRARLQEHVADNQAQLLQVSTTRAERDQVGRIHSAQLRFLVTHSDLLDARALDGRIVDGHGDLRPDHIYLYQPPVVIDCIEFNSEYRTNDVIDELSFLAMCCERWQESSVGESLFAEYEEASGDLCDPQLIAFYKSYRACVRAKVAGLRRQQQAGRFAHDSLHMEHDYLDLADRYVASLDAPFVLIVGGLMGSGKSTLARELQKLLSTELISSDVTRQSVFGFPDAAPGKTGSLPFGTGRYSSDARLANYKQMVACGKRLMRRNTGLIFDATFTMQTGRNLIREFASRYGYQILQVQCECPRDEAVARIMDREQRGASSSEARPEHYDLQVAQAEPLIEDVPVVRVDTTAALAEEQDVVLKELIPLLKRQ